MNSYAGIAPGVWTATHPFTAHLSCLQAGPILLWIHGAVGGGGYGCVHSGLAGSRKVDVNYIWSGRSLAS